MCQVLCNDTFLQTIGEQIGQVISIDNSEAYRAKLFGPKIRLLVRDLYTLPHTVVLPRLDGKGSIEYALEFSGLPNQCGRCRSREHLVRFYLRKEFTGRYKNTPRHVNQRHEHPINNQAHLTPNCTPRTSPTRAPELPTQETTELQQDMNLQHPLETMELNVAQDNTPSPKAQPELDTTSQPSPAPSTTDHQTVKDNNLTLNPDEENFPKLPTPSKKKDNKEPQEQQQSPSTLAAPSHFVWCNKPNPTETHKGGDKGKGKQVPRTPDSAPITRQGYKSGRLADDFWIALNPPHIPASQKKTIRVIPILIKEGKEEIREYLVNTKAATPSSLA